MPLQARLDTLKNQHAKIEQILSAEMQRPAPNSDFIVQQKIAKLRLKDRMERILSPSLTTHSNKA